MLIRLGMRDLTLNTCTLENGWYAEVNSFQYLDAIWMRGETGGLEIGQCWALFQFELDEKFFFFFRSIVNLDVVREIFILSYCDLEIDFTGPSVLENRLSFDQA